MLSISAHANTGKKGIGLATGRHYEKDWQQRVEALNLDWHYSWGYELPAAEPDRVEFVPMIWGWSKKAERNESRIKSIIRQKESGKVTHLLGFNEPCSKKQSSLPVARAIEAWPELMKTDLRLGSPAPVNAMGEWLKDFMQIVDEKDYRVDFVCVHWYGGPNAGALIQHLEKIHKLYNRPIWITEFCPADWQAKTPSDNRHSPESVKKFMLEVLPLLDALDYVERYAWFSSRENNPALHTSALFKDDGSLTELGELYSAHKSAD